MGGKWTVKNDVSPSGETKLNPMHISNEEGQNPLGQHTGSSKITQCNFQ